MCIISKKIIVSYMLHRLGSTIQEVSQM
uniref:Uncharacterized protein n=1 Tax=Anguilla anguilla TaxID=7936 RepID=A0A0E9W4Q7_ANGAN